MSTKEWGDNENLNLSGNIKLRIGLTILPRLEPRKSAAIKSLSLGKEERIDMVVYKLYKHDRTEGAQLIGVLPERRKDQKRTTKESVLNWGREVTGEDLNFDNLSFVQIEK